MPYPFEEVLEYPHQFREAKKAAGGVRDTNRDLRRTRRRLRKATLDLSTPIDKFGKWVNERFSSSHRFKEAYAYARSEHDFYSRDYY